MSNIDRLRQYLSKASFSSASDRFSALACLAELERDQVSHVVITNTGGQHQAKGLPSVEDAIHWQSWLITETGIWAEIAKVD